MAGSVKWLRANEERAAEEEQEEERRSREAREESEHVPWMR